MRIDRTKFEMAMMNKEVSIQDIAKEYGASAQRIRTILNSVNVRPKTLARLAAALGVEPEDIIFNEDQR